ncbi:hypothetical protein C8Q80DRAFT_633029 [Daedaleopsis nitida]|nr:hypothetical protein C8Q80DRAFT_633029 [Daedaleopsis nitida]
MCVARSGQDRNNDLDAHGGGSVLRHDYYDMLSGDPTRSLSSSRTVRSHRTPSHGDRCAPSARFASPRYSLEPAMANLKMVVRTRDARCSRSHSCGTGRLVRLFRTVSRTEVRRRLPLETCCQVGLMRREARGVRYRYVAAHAGGTLSVARERIGVLTVLVASVQQFNLKSRLQVVGNVHQANGVSRERGCARRDAQMTRLGAMQNSENTPGDRRHTSDVEKIIPSQVP